MSGKLPVPLQGRAAGRKRAVDGVLIGRMHSYKITGRVDDLPRAVLDRVVQDRPDLLEKLTDSPDHGVVDTFGRYAADVPPEVPGYRRR